MDSKANYTAVGGYVLGFIALIIAFIVWVAGVGFHERSKVIDIVFSRVSGLKEGAHVKYQGVVIGRVETIEINHKNPQEIIVEVSVSPKVPIKRDVTASIEQQGITGVASIQLAGGTPEAPELRREKGQENPTIYGKSSQLDKAIDNAPEVLNDISSLTSDMKEVVSEDNREALRDILSNLKDLTGGLKKDGVRGGESLGDEITKTVKAAGKAFEEVEGAAREIRIVLQENRGGVKNFAGSGLTSLTKLVAEARDMILAFKRIGESIERSPGRFIHNDPDKGVRLK